jgi:VanZ family protein
MVVSSEGFRTQTFGRINFSGPRRWLWRYGPLILWAVLIFLGSTDVLSAPNTAGPLRRALFWVFPHISEKALSTLQVLLRKAGHFTEYAIMAFFAARAFTTSSRELLRRRWFWLSLFVIMVYALGDEFHQSFVPTRTASIYDSIIDSLGGLTALALMAVRHRRAVTNGLHRPS